MRLLAITLTIIVIAQNPDVDRCEPGLCGGAAMVSAFQQAVQRVLGGGTRLQTQFVSSAPADDTAVTQMREADGVVELSFSPEGQRARLHCYVSREQRWLDREISFGERHGSVHNESSERGRLLGFAVATMYAGDANDIEPAPAPPPTPATAPAAAPPAGAPGPVPSAKIADQSRNPAAPLPAERRPARTAEFAVIASSGLNGTASELGASAGLRLGLAGPLGSRLFLAGRSGNIPEAQASTRTALMGGGLSLAFLPESSSYDVGARLDLFASYFDMSHLSEDDVAPDRRSRWQAGADAVAEGGWRFTRGAGLFLGVGVEGILGKTEVYTHHARVAVVPPFRAIMEVGFRTRF